MRVERDKETRLSQATPDPFLGRTLDGFRIDERIGAGGMGVVYKATQLSLDRAVAIKVLPEQLAKNEMFLDRFDREADLLSRLSHPNVVGIIERGKFENRAYVVMEFVNGQSLREIMKRGPLPPNESLAIVRSVLAALDHAHQKAIVHRDVKPENVLIAPGGVVKVADFGLARLLDPGEMTRLTRTHTLLGTYEYMAPEQRERVKEADERSDIYATGVLLYEMIAGELPIGNFEALSSKHVECDARLDDVVSRSLEKNPARRYQKAADMADAVSRVLDVDAPRESTKSRLLDFVSDRMKFDPLQFAQRLNTLATVTNVLAFCFGVGACAWALAALVGGAVTSHEAHQSFVYALPAISLGMMAWFCMETASQLRGYKPGGRKAQGILALAAAPTGILLPYTIGSWWLLHSFRGASYYDARARGLSALDAVSSLSKPDLDPDAPLRRRTPAPVAEPAGVSVWSWLMAAAGAGAIFLCLRFYSEFPSSSEYGVCGIAALASFWAFVGMPKVYRSSENGPVYAFAGVLVLSVGLILGLVSVNQEKREATLALRYAQQSVTLLHVPKASGASVGVPEKILADASAQSWVRSVADPYWEFPRGLSFEWRNMGSRAQLIAHIDRRVTRTGNSLTHRLSRKEFHLAAALTHLFANRIKGSTAIVTPFPSIHERQQFQSRLKDHPLPEGP